MFRHAIIPREELCGIDVSFIFLDLVRAVEWNISCLLYTSGYLILDVRTAEEFSEKHIPGAVNIPNETIGDQDIPELPDKEQLILVYCRSGNRSKQASEKLVKLGSTKIVEFGGINDWTGETVSGEA